MGTKVKPYKEDVSSKKEQVAKMFDAIAGNYDFLNHFLSLGIDILWRRRAIKELKALQPNSILDIATGTADLAIEASRLNPKKIVGIDISNNMLKHGRQKINTKKLNETIDLRYGDSENLEFDDNEFDALTAGFGVRNFENLRKGLDEMYRVLKTNGKVVIIEPSEPVSFPFKQLYSFYFKGLLPLIGKLFSKDNSAYTYLPQSVEAFPTREKFLIELEKSGFKNVEFVPLTFGIAALYIATK